VLHVFNQNRSGSSLSGDDLWDPNTWDETDAVRIYSSPPRGREPYSDSCFPRYALVSVEDAVLTTWGWSLLRSRGKVDKFYLRRAVTVVIGKDWYEDGKRVQNRRVENLMLHQAVMDRMGIPRPSPKHLVGHRDDNQLDCRRHNLTWLTPGDNQRQAYASGAKVARVTRQFYERMAQDLGL
jgi:hypothetical protein